MFRGRRTSFTVFENSFEHYGDFSYLLFLEVRFICIETPSIIEKNLLKIFIKGISKLLL